MTVLLGDIGGTKSRFVLTGIPGDAEDAPRVLLNDDFPSFEAALEFFLNERGVTGVTQAALAVAGPVLGRSARLTNRPGWVVDADQDWARGARAVVLMNDLEGLARATPYLGEGSLRALKPGVPEGPGQRLVLNLGTGTNLSAIRGDTALEAEFGHSALFEPVAAELREWIGAEAKYFATHETLFSGHAIARLGQVTGRGGAILTGPSGHRIGRLLGLTLRCLCTTFLPRAGVFLSGGVARALFDGAGAEGFGDLMERPFGPETGIGALPVHLITDDLAALVGCRAALKNFHDT